MFLQRVVVALLLLPAGLWALFSSEWSSAILFTTFLLIASWEFSRLMKLGGNRPADFALYGAVVTLVAGRALFPTIDTTMVAIGWLLAAAIFHLWHFERGRQNSVTDLFSTYFGILYIAILGSHFGLVRALPDGGWWLYILLTGIWSADTGAYMIGTWMGKTPLAPNLSPKKTVEGYIGGIVLAIILMPLLLMLYPLLGLNVPVEITTARVILIGVIMGFIPTAGDLTISMVKRSVSVKDTGSLLPGHGGVLDRLDSWLWGVAIGYYLVVYVFLT
jgi:phosphatidate cytidylyltransferase